MAVQILGVGTPGTVGGSHLPGGHLWNLAHPFQCSSPIDTYTMQIVSYTIWYDIWYDIWHDMINIWYDIWYDIYLTAIALAPGGSSTVNIYTD
jgi:hypothetical protein